MARFTKQKSGLYRTNIQLGFSPDGKPIKKYLSAKTIKELEQKIYEAKADLASGLVISDNTTFGDYCQNWLNVYKANKGIQTRNMYKHKLTYCESLNDIPIRKINRMMIQQIINENAVHPRTCEIILLTLKQVFKSAKEDGIMLKNPCIEIDMPRHIPQEKRALTEEEKIKLRSAILQPQERLMLLLLYGTGCRPAEAYALNKDDFDFKNGTISISKSVQFDNGRFFSISVPKTNSSIRSVIVSESILKGIKHTLDKISTYNVLGDNMGQIMSSYKYDTIFKHILQKAGLEGSGITAYVFRHNFATECYYAGVSLKECQRQMGHTSYKMVMEVYAHLDEKRENTRSKMSSMVM